jgi:hypothetical protein
VNEFLVSHIIAKCASHHFILYFVGFEVLTAVSTKMAVFWVVAPCRAMALMMETARTSETLVNFYQTTRRYNSEDSHLRLILYFVTIATSKYKLGSAPVYIIFSNLYSFNFIKVKCFHCHFVSSACSLCHILKLSNDV